MAMNPRLLRPLATSFNPRQIAGLALWLDAADSATITIATGVSQWRDKTSNARHANQSVGNSQPGYSLASLNGKNTLSFDGSNDWLQQSSFTISQPVTFFAVAQSLANNRQVFDGTGSNRQTIYRNASGNWEAWAGTTPLTGASAGTAWAVLSCVFNGSSSAFRVNGGTAITGNAGINSITAGLTIGAFANGTSSYLEGGIAELVYFAAELDAASRAKVEGYLAWKWGLQSQLPYDHPYAKSFPGFGSQTTPTDSDALTYLAAVSAADGTGVEVGVANAVDDFVKGCKADGIWSAIKASCILAGARTLAGALVPLKGTAPTNNNFVSGDYNRETGLKSTGNGAAGKTIDTNYPGDSPGQDDFHVAYYLNEKQAGATQAAYVAHQSAASSGGTQIFSHSTVHIVRNRSSGAETSVGTHTEGFIGMNRASGSEYTFRSGGTTGSPISRASQAPQGGNVFFFGTNSFGGAEARISFYTVGTSLSLPDLDARVSALITAIGAAI